jgi:hypothetical protein
VANDAVRLAEQFSLREPGDMLKDGIRIGDAALEIRLRDDDLALVEEHFPVRRTDRVSQRDISAKRAT